MDEDETPFDFGSLVASPREWWKKRAGTEFYDWPPDEYTFEEGWAEHYADLVVTALTSRESFARLRTRTVDQAIWNLAFDIRGMEWDDEWLAVERCVRAAGEFFFAYYEPRSVFERTDAGLYMFWDTIAVEEFADRPELHELTLALLKRQLDSPNPALRLSAVHGLGHLFTDEARQLLREYAAGLADPAQREGILRVAEHGTA